MLDRIVSNVFVTSYFVSKIKPGMLDRIPVFILDVSCVLYPPPKILCAMLRETLLAIVLTVQWVQHFYHCSSLDATNRNSGDIRMWCLMIYRFALAATQDFNSGMDFRTWCLWAIGKWGGIARRHFGDRENEGMALMLDANITHVLVTRLLLISLDWIINVIWIAGLKFAYILFGLNLVLNGIQNPCAVPQSIFIPASSDMVLTWS